MTQEGRDPAIDLEIKDATDVRGLPLIRLGVDPHPRIVTVRGGAIIDKDVHATTMIDVAKETPTAAGRETATTMTATVVANKS